MFVPILINSHFFAVDFMCSSCLNRSFRGSIVKVIDGTQAIMIVNDPSMAGVLDYEKKRVPMIRPQELVDVPVIGLTSYWVGHI